MRKNKAMAINIFDSGPLAIGWFFRFCFRLQQASFYWITSDGVINRIWWKKWKRSDSSDSDSVELTTPLKTPIFDFRQVIMYQSNRSLNIPPGHTRTFPGHLTPLSARKERHLITTHRGGEFDRQPRFHVMSRADSTWVNKSWRRQTLMNSKEKSCVFVADWLKTQGLKQAVFRI